MRRLSLPLEEEKEVGASTINRPRPVLAGEEEGETKALVAMPRHRRRHKAPLVGRVGPWCLVEAKDARRRRAAAAPLVAALPPHHPMQTVAVGVGDSVPHKPPQCVLVVGEEEVGLVRRRPLSPRARPRRAGRSRPALGLVVGKREEVVVGCLPTTLPFASRRQDSSRRELLPCLPLGVGVARPMSLLEEEMGAEEGLGRVAAALVPPEEDEEGGWEEEKRRCMSLVAVEGR